MAVEILSRAYVTAQHGCFNVRPRFPFPHHPRYISTPSLAVSSFPEPPKKLSVKSFTRLTTCALSFSHGATAMDKLGANPANSCPLTPLGFLERAATVFGDCPSVVYHDTIFTWIQTYRRCLRLASAIVSLGISRGDVVSVLLPNVPAMYEAQFGVPMSGAVLNSINTLLDARTIAVLLGHSGSKLIFTDPAFLPVLQEALLLLPPGHPAPRVILVYDAIDRHGVTHLCGASAVLNMLANVPERVKKPQPGKVRILTAGAPPPAAVLHSTETIGFEVSHGYGLTETAGLVVSCTWKGEWDMLPATERARLKARQGVRRPVLAEVDIVDDKTGRSVPRDGATMGEILLRGGSVMLGYFKDDEGTKAAIRDDGWFYTGDIGVMHPDGYLEIRDRSKDVIICGGENISSVEVESVLYGHPAVREAAVVGRPNEFWGETLCAFVSIKDGADGSVNDAAEVIAWCRERLPRYMVPRTVLFRDELPKTSTGKIQKYELRNLAKELKGM